MLFFVIVNINRKILSFPFLFESKISGKIKYAFFFVKELV